MKRIDSLENIGCFGLTELGYGNNAVEMETTATYDEKTQTFGELAVFGSLWRCFVEKNARGS